jgi:hypothetical protein
MADEAMARDDLARGGYGVSLVNYRQLKAGGF